MGATTRFSTNGKRVSAINPTIKLPTTRALLQPSKADSRNPYTSPARPVVAQRSQPIDSLRRRAARLRNLPQRDSDYRGGERNIDKENPVPRGVLDQPPAQNRTQSSCYGGETPPPPHCFSPRLLLQGSTDKSPHGRDQRRR